MHSTGHHGAAHHGPSLLDLVAEHETTLLEQLEGAQHEARGLVDEAHVAATAFLTNDYAQLEREVAEKRRAAQDQRESESARIQHEAETKVAAIRERAAGKIDMVFNEIISRVLPRA